MKRDLFESNRVSSCRLTFFKASEVFASNSNELTFDCSLLFLRFLDFHDLIDQESLDATDVEYLERVAFAIENLLGIEHFNYERV